MAKTVPGAVTQRLATLSRRERECLDVLFQRGEGTVAEVMERARAAGQLRSDVDVGDVMIAVAQLSRPPAGTDCFHADRFVHRHLQLFLDGLRAPARSTLPGAAVTLEDLRRP